ncbi:MAG: hypothetical protein R2939_08420 [Kofleriaceae bacterium]
MFPLGAPAHKELSPAAWTEAEAERLLALGLDWIETDDPERLLAMLA